MNCRRATVNDVDAVYPLVRSFHEETLGLYGLTIDEADAKLFMGSMALNGLCLVAEMDGQLVGVLGGSVSTYPMDNSQVCFQESIWYVMPEHRGSIGLRLFLKLEDECRSLGVNWIVMANIQNSMSDKVSEFYKKCQYAMFEQHWIKKI